MKLKSVFKLNLIKIILALIFFGISSYFSYDTYWSGKRIGFPIKYYKETGFIPSCYPQPCAGVYSPSFSIYFSILLIISNFLVYYFVSFMIIFLLTKIRIKR